MTEQEIFDTVYTHLMKQGRRSFDASAYYCAYLSADGLRCAVGCLLTDVEARHLDSFTGSSGIRGLAENGEIPERLVPHVDFLERLQSVHDLHTVPHWKDELTRIAVSRELQVPVSP